MKKKLFLVLMMIAGFVHASDEKSTSHEEMAALWGVDSADGTKKMVSPEQELYAACRSGELSLCEVKTLIDEVGPNVWRMVLDNGSVLYRAVRSDDECDTLALWIAKITSKISILHVAAQKDNAELFALLEGRGADTQAKNYAGLTPRQLAPEGGAVEKFCDTGVPNY